MQKEIIPDLYTYLDILSGEIKRRGSTQATMENIMINLRHSHAQIQYEKTALARLLSHPLFNTEVKEQSEIPKPVKNLLEWFTHEYRPNPFLDSDLFYRLFKNKHFYQLYCIFTNLPEGIKGASSCKIGYDGLDWESKNPYELVVYGYICQLNLLYLGDDSLLHNNPVVALNYFVKAAHLGFDCWKEIERVIITTELKDLQLGFCREELFQSTSQYILDKISHGYSDHSLESFNKETSKVRLGATFCDLNAMLHYVNNGSTFYLKAESLTFTLAVSMAYTQFFTIPVVSLQIRQLYLYLQAAAYNHIGALEKFLAGWKELTNKTLTSSDMSAFIDFNKLLVSSVGGLLLNEKVSILQCIEYCDALHLKLTDLETNSELLSIIDTFFRQVISSNKIDSNLPASALGKLIPIISSLPEPSFSLLDLKTVIESRISALIAKKKESSPIINNRSLPEKKENSPIITNDSPITNTGSLDDFVLDESEAKEEKLLPVQDSEYRQLLKLLQEPAFSKFNLLEEKSRSAPQNPVRLFPTRKNRVEGSSTGLIRSHSFP
jgi:hypothetical protein